ncbi:serine protease [Pseudobacillus wudalianchiensis]|uniref:Serine protease n=1 Tax=Pseudobacillus wudalianchiensis TaxID=1743143 RepID=A0A1B9ABW7_9BACI|nr:serine protease [Bacillus wudalianchiensis]OCA81334.1 serine protease [Bacillus wudalianchiensis]
MNIHKIEEEIDQLKAKLLFLQNRVRVIQQNCDHRFKGDQYYETCMKCKKVNVLYY